MQQATDIGKYTHSEPIWKRLFVKKEVAVNDRVKKAAKTSNDTIFPYGEEYKKVRSFYRFVE